MDRYDRRARVLQLVDKGYMAERAMSDREAELLDVLALQTRRPSVTVLPARTPTHPGELTVAENFVRVNITGADGVRLKALDSGQYIEVEGSINGELVPVRLYRPEED